MIIDDEKLLQLIKNGEDSLLELKELKFKDKKVLDPDGKSIADEFAAMANSCSGTFIFGVNDKSRVITGIAQENLDIVETWLRTICNDQIDPPLPCIIRKKSIQDGELQNIIIVEISKSLFVHQSPGGYFYRIGSSKRKMTTEMLARLLQQRSQTRIIRFDEQAVPGSTLNDLSPRLWEKFKSPLTNFSDEEFLLKLKLLTKDENNNIVPTVSGILMATEEPQKFINNAYIQAVSYRGLERDANYQLDSLDITGPLDEQIDKAIFFVKKNMKIAARKIPARQDLPQYSINAVFEAIVNAVAHRDYSIYGSKIRLHMFDNRLEIFSPGSIPNTMTIDSLPLRQSARNELVTSLLAKCPVNEKNNLTIPRTHIMDKRGEGVPIILRESMELSGKKPEYKLLDDTELMLTIYAASFDR